MESLRENGKRSLKGIIMLHKNGVRGTRGGYLTQKQKKGPGDQPGETTELVKTGGSEADKS